VPPVTVVGVAGVNLTVRPGSHFCTVGVTVTLRLCSPFRIASDTSAAVPATTSRPLVALVIRVA
jgi:hypothetical protein